MLGIGVGEFNLASRTDSQPAILPGLSTWKVGRRLIADASAGV